MWISGSAAVLPVSLVAVITARRRPRGRHRRPRFRPSPRPAYTAHPELPALGLMHEVSPSNPYGGSR
jgi:hypothetical protein